MLLLLLIALQIGIAAWLIEYLIRHDRGPKEPEIALFIAGLLGVAAIIAGFILEALIIPTSILPDDPKKAITAGALNLLFGALLVGCIEEGVKAGPLSAFIYRKGYFNEITDGIIYFAIAGLIFGLLENIGYTLSLGTGAGVARIITTPFMHGGFSCIIGWTLARHKLLKKPGWEVVAGVAAAVGLHALYDFGLFYGRGWSVLLSFAIAILVNLMVFILYKRATVSDLARGLSTTGINHYCRNCGFPNFGHTIFCTNCGRHT